jgi:hypothetical protein
MTSSTSTFPYDVDACIKFIQLLKDARGMTFFCKRESNLDIQSDHAERDIDGHTTCLVGKPFRYVCEVSILTYLACSSSVEQYW